MNGRWHWVSYCRGKQADHRKVLNKSKFEANSPRVPDHQLFREAVDSTLKVTQTNVRVANDVIDIAQDTPLHPLDLRKLQLLYFEDEAGANPFNASERFPVLICRIYSELCTCLNADKILQYYSSF